MRTPLRLVLALLVAASVLGCSAVPDSFACAHCACGPGARSASQPVLCSTVGREPACCLFLGS